MGISPYIISRMQRVWRNEAQVYRPYPQIVCTVVQEKTHAVSLAQCSTCVVHYCDLLVLKYSDSIAIEK